MNKKKGKTVLISVRFFTNDLKRKAVWDCGSVFLSKQTQHGITSPMQPEMFNGLEEIATKIKIALKRQNMDIVRYNPEKTKAKVLE